MSMSKKDFIALADMVKMHNRNALEQDQFNAVQMIVLAEFCREQNPRFMRERWLGYIAGTNGKNGGTIKKS